MTGTEAAVFVRIDLRPHPPVVTLEEPDDCTSFHLAVAGGTDTARVYAALIHDAAGRLDSGDALVTVDAVRRMAAGRVADDWAGRFDAMLDYARGRGWFDATNHAIRAHVDYVDV